MSDLFSEIDPGYSDLPSINEAVFTEINDAAKKKGQFFEKHIVDEKLDDVDRALYLLNYGSSIQKIHVMQNLGHIFSTNKDKAVKKILQHFIDNLWKESKEMQILIGRHISQIFPHLSYPRMSETHSMIKIMMQLKEPTVSSVWEDALVASIDHLPNEILTGEVLSFCLAKGSLSESEKNRVLCCKLFGALSKRLSSEQIEEEFLSKALSLCQDTAFTVRLSMAEQIKIIANAIGPEKSKDRLVKELIQLVNDETKEVKQVAFESLVQMTQLFDVNYRKVEILPVFVELIRKPPIPLQRQMISQFGDYFYYISNAIHDETTMNLFCNYFKQVSQSSEAINRYYCAYNFPAVVLSIGSKRFSLYMASAYKSLSEDKDVNTRKCIACGVHEVARLIGPELANQHIKEIFMKLLKDEKIEVQNAVAAKLYITMESIKTHQKSYNEQLFSSFIPPIVAYEQAVQKASWRTQNSLYSNFEYFDQFFTPDQIHEVFIPMLRQQLYSAPFPVKEVAAKCIVVLTRKLCNHARQVEIFRGFAEDMGCSKSYQHRIAFLQISSYVLDYYSRKFFKEYILDYVMKLSSDKVSNIRRKFCLFIPKIKCMLLSTSDVKNQARLKESLSYLMLDKDRDVAEAAVNINKQLIHLTNEKTRSQKSRAQYGDDLQDEKKEDEENTWLEAEHEMERNRRKSDTSRNLTSSKTNSQGNGKIKNTKKSNGASSSSTTPGRSVKKESVISNSRKKQKDKKK